jgi:hypothetical protein
MASESSGLSEFASAAEGFEASEILITAQTEARAVINYENIVFPNAPVQK